MALRYAFVPFSLWLGLAGLPLPAVAQVAPSDTVRAELAAGRFWHATGLLEDAVERGAPPERRLLLARAHAGWNHWDGVLDALEGQGWLDRVEGGAGWALLARALEARERWDEAADAWASYLDAPAAASDPMAPARRVRLARSRLRAGGLEGALAALDAVAGPEPEMASWAAVDLARLPSAEGRPGEVRALMERVAHAPALRSGWSRLPRALLEAGDSSAALAAYRSAAEELEGPDRATALAAAGDIAHGTGDPAAAVRAWRTALDEAPRTNAGARAAAALLVYGDLDASGALEAARSLDRAGDDAAALRAYDRHARLSGGAERLPPEVRLERATLMAATPGRQGDAITEFRALSRDPPAALGPVILDRWAALRRRQGRSGDVATIRGWLLERYPESSQAAEVVFFRGDAAHDRNDLAAALGHYEELVAMAPAENRAGLARMRAGQIYLHRGRVDEAAATFEGYLAAFPDGRRWEEAAYWAAAARLQRGDTARAREHVERLRREQPLSYYTMQAADLLGEPYALDLPEGEDPPFPAWLREGLRHLDLLDTAGLAAAADAQADALVERAAGDRGAMLRLAEELVARTRTIPGINLVWALRRDGAPWTLRLVRAAYPFPFREAATRESAEWGVDPWLAAGIMRQESAFDPDIRSGAGAVGLMQVMPATGRQLSRAGVGPPDFREAYLEVPDVNLHLGHSYLAEMLDRFDGNLPFVLSAYNAGPHRADQWKAFPEAADPLRFTERIPYGETRDYVKQVTRNRRLYRLLYGGGTRPSADDRPDVPVGERPTAPGVP